jgi:hypothetical protein
LDYSVLQIKTKIVSCHTADSKPVKQEVNGTVILPPLVFPALTYYTSKCFCSVRLVFAKLFYESLMLSPTVSALLGV